MDVPAIISDKFQQFLVFVKVPQLQFIDRVGVSLFAETGTQSNCAEDRCDCTGAVLGPVGTRPSLCNDRLVGFHSVENCGSSASTVLYRVVDVPAAIHRQGWGVPVILQRQVHAASRRCLRFSSSAELDYDGSEGVFGRILRHFSRSSGFPELSARFQSWSPR